jgi:lipopolysaccharide/colanic/teichoic acid biosynthesis glycosyltransferase
MRHGETARAAITSGSDPRVLPVGRVLRSFKVDEIPQLLNIVLGHMAFIGPRPEAPEVVEHYYTRFMMETLSVKPGLTSPGSLDYYAREHLLPGDAAQAETAYAQEFLPRKIALDIVYVRNRTRRYDAELFLRTVASTLGLHTLFQGRQRWEQIEAANLLSSAAELPPVASTGGDLSEARKSQ